MQKRYDVYAIGNALVDTEIEVSDDFLDKMAIGKGLMTLVDEPRQKELISALATTSAKRAAGGSACNTVVAVARFGGKAFYSCRVADDPDGHFYVDDLTEAGVDSNLTGLLPEGTTGKCLVLITPDAERSMNSFLGISANIDENSIDEDALARSRYVYLEGYLASSETGRAAAARLHHLARKANVKTALTFSDAAMVEFCREGLEQMFGDGVDLLFCNEKEAVAYTGCDSMEVALESLKELAREIVITLGDKGAMIWDGKHRHNIPVTPVTALDSNGAGDMFAGAYLYGITHGMSPTEAGKLASRAAAKVVSQFGPRLDTATHKALLGRG
jgi:fructokinase